MTVKVTKVSIDKLVPAEWNYKYEGTEDEIIKLAESIKQDASAGVLAVRVLGDKLEVIDGNHRLAAIKYLKWKEVYVENFGEISLATAVTIARRRNHQWFEDDKLKLSKLMTDTVIPEIPIEDLTRYMPESEEDFNNYLNMASFEWEDPEEKPQGGNGSQDPENIQPVNLKVSKDVYKIWLSWTERVKDMTGIDSDERAFEFALIEAINCPVENLKVLASE